MHTGHNLYPHLSHHVYYIYERINYTKMLQIKFPIGWEKQWQHQRQPATNWTPRMLYIHILSVCVCVIFVGRHRRRRHHNHHRSVMLVNLSSVDSHLHREMMWKECRSAKHTHVLTVNECGIPAHARTHKQLPMSYWKLNFTKIQQIASLHIIIIIVMAVVLCECELLTLFRWVWVWVLKYEHEHRCKSGCDCTFLFLIFIPPFVHTKCLQPAKHLHSHSYAHRISLPLPLCLCLSFILSRIVDVLFCLFLALDAVAPQWLYVLHSYIYL